MGVLWEESEVDDGRRQLVMERTGILRNIEERVTPFRSHALVVVDGKKKLFETTFEFFFCIIINVYCHF